GGLAGRDSLLELERSDQHFDKREPTVETGATAVGAYLARDAEAARADAAHEALREHALYRGGDLVARHADVDQPCDRARRVVGVECRENEMPSERRLNRDLRGL